MKHYNISKLPIGENLKGLRVTFWGNRLEMKVIDYHQDNKDKAKHLYVFFSYLWIFNG